MNRANAALAGFMLITVGLLFRFMAQFFGSEWGSDPKFATEAIADIANIVFLVGLASFVASLVYEWRRGPQ